jgi:hypothetical protein
MIVRSRLLEFEIICTYCCCSSVRGVSASSRPIPSTAFILKAREQEENEINGEQADVLANHRHKLSASACATDGVRISCDIFDRKSDLIFVAFSARSIAICRLSISFVRRATSVSRSELVAVRVRRRRALSMDRAAWVQRRLSSWM